MHEEQANPLVTLFGLLVVVAVIVVGAKVAGVFEGAPKKEVAVASVEQQPIVVYKVQKKPEPTPTFAPYVPPPPQPKPTPTKPVEPPKPVASDFVVKMDAIFAQMPTLRTQYTAISTQLDPLLSEMAALEKQVDTMQTQGRRLRAEYNKLSNDINAGLQLRQLARNSGEQSAVDARIGAIRTRQSIAEGNYNQLDIQAREANTRIAELKSLARPLQERLRPIVEQGRKLESETLDLLAPFSGVPMENPKEAEQYFTDGIAASRGGDPSLSHFCRGCVRYRSGQKLLALGDLAAACDLAPKQAAFAAVHGYAMFACGKEQDGRDKLLAATKIDETSAIARCLYSVVLFRSGAISTAETQLKQAAENGNAEAAMLLGYFKATSSIDSQRSALLATKYAESAHFATNGNSWRALIVLAAARAESRQYQEATGYAQFAAGLAPIEKRGDCDKLVSQLKQEKPLRLDWKTADLLIAP